MFVSVDPERDTPRVLKSYLASFSLDFVGLTGDPVAIADMLHAYRLLREPIAGANGDYAVNHTSRIFLVDAHGILRDTIAQGESDATAVRKLEILESH